MIVPGVTRRVTSRRTTDLPPRFTGVRRVLDLFADGDPMAKADQPVQIILRALDRDAAHRNVVALMLAALGQDDAERFRGDLGVLEEQFVEIAHPVKQERAGIGRLDVAILGDHRRDFRWPLAGVAGSRRAGAPLSFGRGAGVIRGAAAVVGRSGIAPR